MTQLRLVGIMTLMLLAMCGEVVVRAQENDNQREGRGQRDGRRGRGGFGRGGFGAPGGGGVLGLLRVDEVREELRVTEEQQELIRILADELNEGRPEFPESFRQMTNEEREDFRTKSEAWSARRDKEAQATLVTLLEPEQYQRLTEIRIQTQGVNALTDAEVAAKLNLTDEQSRKIAEAIDENREKAREQMQATFSARGEGRPDLAAIREQMEAARKEHENHILALLTEEQKAAFEAMKGEVFEMPEPLFGRGGNRRGFRSGNRP